jgi:hypothetical protein
MWRAKSKKAKPRVQWYRRGLNTIKDKQQNHMCQGGRSVLNVKLSVIEVGAALYL